MKFHPDAIRIMATFVGSPERAAVPRNQFAWGLATSMRKIIDRLVDTRAPDSDLEALAKDLAAVADRLDQFDHGRNYGGASEASIAAGGDGPTGHADYSPVIGPANPLAAPMVVHLDDDVVVGIVTFGHAYEGPPGHVHGGFLAAAFDDLLGATQAMSGNPGMTGSLTVNYRAPTPLHRELRFEGTLDRIDGRKIYTSGRLYNGDTLCAEADGLFISIDFAKMSKLMEERR